MADLFIYTVSININNFGFNSYNILGLADILFSILVSTTIYFWSLIVNFIHIEISSCNICRILNFKWAIIDWLPHVAYTPRISTHKNDTLRRDPHTFIDFVSHSLFSVMPHESIQGWYKKRVSIYNQSKSIQINILHQPILISTYFVRTKTIYWRSKVKGDIFATNKTKK